MESAINMVKKENTYHKNVGVYNLILGTKRHAVIKKKMLLPPVKKKPVIHLPSAEIGSNSEDNHESPLRPRPN